MHLVMEHHLMGGIAPGIDRIVMLLANEKILEK
jgi:aspartyl-tRNA synthetase